MNKFEVDTIYLFRLAAGVLGSCLFSELVIADESATPFIYEPAVQIAPPPPGPWVSQLRTSKAAPHYVVGSYRPMNEFTTDDMRQMPADNIWDPDSRYISGPSSFDIYGQPEPSNNIHNGPGYRSTPAMRPIQYSESSTPFVAQPVPGAYETRQLKPEVDDKAMSNYQNSHRQPSIPSWPQQR